MSRGAARALPIGRSARLNQFQRRAAVAGRSSSGEFSGSSSCGSGFPSRLAKMLLQQRCKNERIDAVGVNRQRIAVAMAGSVRQVQRVRASGSRQTAQNNPLGVILRERGQRPRAFGKENPSTDAQKHGGTRIASSSDHHQPEPPYSTASTGFDRQQIETRLNGKAIRAELDFGKEFCSLRESEARKLGLGTNPNCCRADLRVDLAEAKISLNLVRDKKHQSNRAPLILGRSFLLSQDVALVHRHGRVRLFQASLAPFAELDRIPPVKPTTKSIGESVGQTDCRVDKPGPKDASKILASGLLNQLQPNVRWSSSLKVRDKELLQPEKTFRYADLSVRLAGPCQLQPKPQVSDLAFGKYFTDHMLKIFYHEALGGWQTPEITPFENLVLHPAAKVLHYALELFEGMKAYRGADGKIRVFRPELNMDRMNASALRSGLPTFNGTELIKCINRLISIDQEWVPHSEASSLYIRPTLIGIDPTLGVASSDSALLYVILSPVGMYFAGRKGGNIGISLLADPRYTRAWPGGCGDRKMGSNYAPTIHVQREASEKGLQQVLWLYGEDHQITEVGTMNVFVYLVNELGEKELVTPPLNGLILPGVTRNSILSLAKEWGHIRVSERVITMPEVLRLLSENRLLEIFGAGTACIVSPVTNILYMDQDLYIPTLDHAEPIYKTLLKHLTEIQYGYVDHPWASCIE